MNYKDLYSNRTMREIVANGCGYKVTVRVRPPCYIRIPVHIGNFSSLASFIVFRVLKFSIRAHSPLSISTFVLRPSITRALHSASCFMMWVCFSFCWLVQFIATAKFDLFDLVHARRPIIDQFEPMSSAFLPPQSMLLYFFGRLSFVTRTISPPFFLVRPISVQDQKGKAKWKKKKTGQNSNKSNRLFYGLVAIVCLSNTLLNRAIKKLAAV